MKLLVKNANQFKQGAASLYIVIFTTLLLGLIVLSFTRVMVSDAQQTSNQDLSQSAYDSALAGVEDAKVALLKYHDCISQNATAPGTTCGNIVTQMQAGIAAQSCDTVQAVLGREINAERGVIIQERQTGDDNSAYLEQAYTCVTIAEKLADYRSFLNSENRIRIVPLRTSGSGAGIDDIRFVKFSWYSAGNYQDQGNSTRFINDKNYFALPDKNERIKPPVIFAQLIQTDNYFQLSQLSASNSNAGTDRAAMLLYPTTGTPTNPDNVVSAAQLIDSNSKAYRNEPFKVHCETTANAPFLCSAYFEIPRTFGGGARNEGNSYAVLSLPYGEPSTDFSIMLCTNRTGCTDDGTGTNPGASVISFTGVQTKVDSTGRANDLFRRVETRIELVDTYFPYPEFAIQMTSQGEESKIQKSFWVSNNCWVAKNGGFNEQNGRRIPGCVDSSNI